MEKNLFMKEFMSFHEKSLEKIYDELDVIFMFDFLFQEGEKEFIDFKDCCLCFVNEALDKIKDIRLEDLKQIKENTLFVVDE